MLATTLLKSGGGSGGGGSTIGVVAHSVFSGGVNGGSATAINATGAKMLAVATGSINATVFTVTDNYSNTYTARWDVQGSNNRTLLWTCDNPTVGAGLVVTLTGTSIYASCCVAAFSNTLQPTAFDQHSVGALGTATTINTGNITPTQNNELILATLVSSSVTGSAPTIATTPGGIIAPFAVLDSVNFANGVSYGSALAWGVLPTASTFSATWTEAASPANNNAAFAASFKGLP